MTTTVAVLGTGIMGAAMARNLLKAGLCVHAFNRTPGKALALEAEGARCFGTAAEAVRDADIVLTMFSDGVACREVMQNAGALAALPAAALWLQMGTVGVEAIEGLAQLAAGRSVAFVDCPVLGTKQPAESGELVVLASGDPALAERCRPVFDAVGKKTLWVGSTAGPASRLKLVINTWVVGLVAVLAETLAVADALGVDGLSFLDAIDGGPLGPPYARIKGRAMLDHSYPPAFPLRLALKDARLVLAAVGRTGLKAHITNAVASSFERAVEAGHGDQDMAAVYEAIQPR